MALLLAVWPLCRVKSDLQDFVIMLLRKMMYRQDVDGRCVGRRQGMLQHLRGLQHYHFCALSAFDLLQRPSKVSDGLRAVVDMCKKNDMQSKATPCVRVCMCASFCKACNAHYPRVALLCQVDRDMRVPEADLPAPSGQPPASSCGGPQCSQLQPGITQSEILTVRQQRCQSPAGGHKVSPPPPHTHNGCHLVFQGLLHPDVLRDRVHMCCIDGVYMAIRPTALLAFLEEIEPPRQHDMLVQINSGNHATACRLVHSGWRLFVTNLEGACVAPAGVDWSVAQGPEPAGSCEGGPV